MVHAFDNFVVGIALAAVLIFFLGCVIVSIVDCFRPMKVAQANNFNYVGTVVAGLVLTVASGALGIAPGAVTGVQPNASNAAVSARMTSTPSVTLASAQVGAFKNVYTATYLILGVVCLCVFVIPTPRVNELVKSVGLTTLAFLGLIVSNNLQQSGSALSVRLSEPQSVSSFLVPQTGEPSK